MARTARLLLKNVYFHVMSRGHHGQKIFFNDADYHRYLYLIKKYKIKFQINLFGFCLMPNHTHLIVRPKEAASLSLFMKGLNQSYAQYFNFKYGKKGYLWQARFKSMVITEENYLVRCIEYVEFNPIRAKLTILPKEYPWCSYKQRLSGQFDDFLNPIMPLGDVPFSQRSGPRQHKGDRSKLVKRYVPRMKGPNRYLTKTRNR